MTLDLEVRVKDRESGIETEHYVQLSLSPRELGNLHKLISAIESGNDIDFVSGIE
jgi:hypothetical protein